MLSIMALVLESSGQGTRRVGGGVGTVLFLPLTTLMPCLGPRSSEAAAGARTAAGCSTGPVHAKASRELHLCRAPPPELTEK